MKKKTRRKSFWGEPILVSRNSINFGDSSGASFGACLGHHPGHVWGIIWGMSGHYMGHVWAATTVQSNKIWVTSAKIKHNV